VLKVLVEPSEDSKAEEWSIVTSGPAILARFGWSRNSVEPGDQVSVICNPLSDGSPGCRLHTLVILRTSQTLNTKLPNSRELGIEYGTHDE
jgi:hypothetical protein